MKFIQNLSIRNKLLLISLIPLSTLLYFLALAIGSELEKRNNLKRVYEDVLEIEKISDVISNVQEERTYAISYLTSLGKEDRTELFNTRILADKAQP